MSRAVLCLALFAALFLAAARCLGGFGSFSASAEQAWVAPGDSGGHDSPDSAPLLEDDADDASEALLPPAFGAMSLVTRLVGPCNTLSVLATPALFSVLPRGLDRPPRA